jgi:hypothetical protein
MTFNRYVTFTEPEPALCLRLYLGDVPWACNLLFDCGLRRAFNLPLAYILPWVANLLFACNLPWAVSFSGPVTFPGTVVTYPPWLAT